MFLENVFNFRFSLKSKETIFESQNTSNYGAFHSILQMLRLITKGAQALFNLEIEKKEEIKHINPNFHHSKVSSLG